MILSKQNSYKGTDLDEIPAKVLNDGTSFIKIPVTFTINMSISENCVSNAMKIAMVKPNWLLEITDQRAF